MHNVIDKTLLNILTDRFGGKYDVNPKILQAIIGVESSYIIDAVRFEPNWSYPYNVKKYADMQNITRDTEKVLQSCSWGLCQLMGTVCRELGYMGPLQLVTDPEINIALGAKKFSELKKRFKETKLAISAYNAGYPKKDQDGELVNIHYVNKVLNLYHDLYATAHP